MDEMLRQSVVPCEPQERPASAVLLEEQTREFVHFYCSLSAEQRPAFLAKLTAEYSMEHSRVGELCSWVAVGRQLGVLLQTKEQLRSLLTPPPRYGLLISCISPLEDGVRFIVELQADILQWLQSELMEHMPGHIHS